MYLDIYRGGAGTAQRLYNPASSSPGDVYPGQILVSINTSTDVPPPKKKARKHEEEERKREEEKRERKDEERKRKENRLRKEVEEKTMRRR